MRRKLCHTIICLNIETKQKFEDIGSKLYNFKYSLEAFINELEGDAEISLGNLCLLLILRDYFNKLKEDYNKLEEDLGVLF